MLDFPCQLFVLVPLSTAHYQLSTIQMAYEELLTKTGITKDQALIYETLLKNGVLPASKIALKVGIKRGLCYKILDELLLIGLAEKIDKKVALFAPAHPAKIKDIVKQKSEELETTQSALTSILGAMTSDYNLFLGKPNVRFFEGINGLIESANDSLDSKTEILEYIDNKSVAENIPEFNEKYSKQRKTKNIKKKLLCVDSPFNRERAQKIASENTEIRFVESEPFATVMQIYDNKVSYITLDKERMIGIVIESQEVYQMHKTVFESQWQKAKTI